MIQFQGRLLQQALKKVPKKLGGSWYPIEDYLNITAAEGLAEIRYTDKGMHVRIVLEGVEGEDEITVHANRLQAAVSALGEDIELSQEGGPVIVKGSKGEATIDGIDTKAFPIHDFDSVTVTGEFGPNPAYLCDPLIKVIGSVDATINFEMSLVHVLNGKVAATDGLIAEVIEGPTGVDFPIYLNLAGVSALKALGKEVTVSAAEDGIYASTEDMDLYIPHVSDGENLPDIVGLVESSKGGDRAILDWAEVTSFVTATKALSGNPVEEVHITSDKGNIHFKTKALSTSVPVDGQVDEFTITSSILGRLSGGSGSLLYVNPSSVVVVSGNRTMIGVKAVE